ncbi:PREDICTED: rho guanine nucleotide exchange factor 37 [Ceratotherium simum simum]|uniref:Rho guanine nucleotide exchange factor 37 n=1 Tax=Ceratotherium simum simum TaxID=73337 RepID=A0ABM1CQ74_CERSS|nr:PREDICTED: rho guanine nucleotide exchange factor 37 [Ceratotherium simum simum]
MEPADMADHGADELSSGTGSPDGEGRVSADRSLLHQRLAVRELIDTEVSYLHMLQLCASDIRSRLQQLPQGDLDVLFSNIDDIIKVNSRFLHDLQETASREEEQVQLIGNVFLEFQEELEQVYKVYCASYDQALLLVDAYRKEPELQREIQGIVEAVVWCLSPRQLPHHHIPEPAFRKLVEDALGQSSHQLHSFQKNFEKVQPPPTIQPLLPGAERQVQALLSRYGPGKLYQVTNNISGAGTLDLTLPRGQIVALLQNKDTKGNSGRWLVDTGGHRGYVPAGKLELYRVVPREEELTGQVGPHQDSRRLTQEPTPAPVPSVPTVTQVVAVYPFVARSSHEVSLQAGQPVTVLEAQDKKGNPEWSLVEVNGQRGYVPSSFLARAPGPAPWGWSLPS